MNVSHIIIIYTYMHIYICIRTINCVFMSSQPPARVECGFWGSLDDTISVAAAAGGLRWLPGALALAQAIDFRTICSELEDKSYKKSSRICIQASRGGCQVTASTRGRDPSPLQSRFHRGPGRPKESQSDHTCIYGKKTYIHIYTYIYICIYQYIFKYTYIYICI